MDTIDCIYYINLNKRTDRNTEFLECMNNLEVPLQKIQRIPGVYERLGCLGCTKSHILALETFLASENNTCIIFEDDFQYKNKETFWSTIQAVFDTKTLIDVLQLSYNHKYYPEYYHIISDTEFPFLKKVHRTITSSSYVITRKFAPILLENLKESSELLSKHGRINNNAYVLDVYWNKIQPTSNWYIISPALGHQRASYSDICQNYQEYGV